MNFDAYREKAAANVIPASEPQRAVTSNVPGSTHTQPISGLSFGSIPVRPTVSRMAVSEPDSPAEREAEAVSSQAMRAGASNIQSSETQQADRAENANAYGDVSSTVDQGLSGGGQPLDKEAQSFLEPRFGVDFSNVRIHTDSSASRSAEAIDARAYTVGSDIAFGDGEYKPNTHEGKRLLAHEAAHVAQNDGGKGGQAGRVVHRFFALGMGGFGGIGGPPAAPAADPMASAMFETGVVTPITRARSEVLQNPPALQQAVFSINSASDMLDTIQQTATAQNNEKLAMYSLSLNNALDQPRVMILQQLGNKFSPEMAAAGLDPSESKLGAYFDMIKTNMAAPAQPMIPPGALDPGVAPGPLDPGGALMPGATPIGAGGAESPGLFPPAPGAAGPGGIPSAPLAPGSAGPAGIPNAPLGPGLATPTPNAPLTPGVATPTPVSPIPTGAATPKAAGPSAPTSGTAKIEGAAVSGSGNAAETGWIERIREQMEK